MEPKYHEESRLYWRARAIEDPANPEAWQPGMQCVLPADIVEDLVELAGIYPKALIDVQKALLMRDAVENQLFDMMGGMNGY